MALKLFRNLKPSAAQFKGFGHWPALALIGLVLIFMFYRPAVAQPAGPGEIAKTQSLIVRGLENIKRDRWTKGRDILAATRDPLAARLYYWLIFTHDFKRYDKDYNFTKIAAFMRRNPAWPGLAGFARTAEDLIPQDLPSARALSWFDEHPPRSARGMDMYLEALLIAGREDDARAVLSDWWAAALLSRDDQRLLYRKYHEYIGREAHRRRFDRLLHAGAYSNAKGIARVLGDEYVKLAAARIALAERNPGVDSLIDQVPAHLQNDPGLLYERLRWRRRNDLNVGAMKILHKAEDLPRLENPRDWWRERHILIRRLLEDGMHKSAYLLARNHRQTSGFTFAQAEWIAGWLALSFMSKPVEAFKRFEHLYQNVSTPISKARAAYWAGRAAKAHGQLHVAQGWFEEAARYSTTFYGQTAAAETARTGQIDAPPLPEIGPALRAGFERNELIRSARLLNEAGMQEEASDFLWQFAQNEATPPAYLFAAMLAMKIDQPQDAVRIAKKATREGMFLTAQSYPLMTSYLGDVNLEWALVHALMRQESLFDTRAVSPAGALGVMQIMPSTARQVARKLGIRHDTQWLLSRPDHNIRLGTHYLAQMLERYNNYYPLAIAAYNAGPNRVDRWLEDYGDPRLGEVDLLDFIELMPIYETRNYVQRILEGVYVYRLRLSGEQPEIHGLRPIHVAMR